jgi:hypothetical protein
MAPLRPPSKRARRPATYPPKKKVRKIKTPSKARPVMTEAPICPPERAGVMPKGTSTSPATAEKTAPRTMAKTSPRKLANQSTPPYMCLSRSSRSSVASK